MSTRALIALGILLILIVFIPTGMADMLMAIISGFGAFFRRLAAG